MYAYKIQELANEAKHFNKDIFVLQNERIDYVLDLALFRYDLKNDIEIDIDLLDIELQILNHTIADVTSKIVFIYQIIENKIFEIENFNF